MSGITAVAKGLGRIIGKTAAEGGFHGLEEAAGTVRSLGKEAGAKAAEKIKDVGAKGAEMVEEGVAGARAASKAARSGEKTMRSSLEAIGKAGLGEKVVPRIARNGDESYLVLLDKETGEILKGDEFLDAAKRIVGEDKSLEGILDDTGYRMILDADGGARAFEGFRLEVPTTISTKMRAGANVMRAKGGSGGGPLVAIREMAREGTAVYDVAKGAKGTIVKGSTGPRSWLRAAGRTAGAPAAVAGVGAGAAAVAGGGGILDGVVAGGSAALGTLGAEADAVGSALFGSRGGGSAADHVEGADSNPIQDILSVIGQNGNFALILGGLAASFLGDGIIAKAGKLAAFAGIADTICMCVTHGKHIPEVIGDLLSGMQQTGAGGKDAAANISADGSDGLDGETAAMTAHARTVGQARAEEGIGASQSDAPPSEEAERQCA